MNARAVSCCICCAAFLIAPAHAETFRWCDDDAVLSINLESHNADSFPDFPDRVARFLEALPDALEQEGFQVAPLSEETDATAMIYMVTDLDLSEPLEWFTYIKKKFKKTVVTISVVDGPHTLSPFTSVNYPFVPIDTIHVDRDVTRWGARFDPEKKARNTARQFKRHQERSCALAVVYEEFSVPDWTVLGIWGKKDETEKYHIIERSGEGEYRLRRVESHDRQSTDDISQLVRSHPRYSVRSSQLDESVVMGGYGGLRRFGPDGHIDTLKSIGP